MKTFAKITAVLLLSLILSTPASALRSSVYFLGQADQFVFHPGTNWSDTDLFDGFEGAMPGDSLTEEINIRNASNDCDYVKIYLKAAKHENSSEVQAPVLEKENISTMEDFLSQLSMKVTNNGEVIYEASPDQLDGLSDYVLLGKYNPGDSSTLNITLNIPIELGNKYMHRVGEVDWVFMAECYVNEEIIEPDNPGTPVTPDTPSGEPKPLPNPNNAKTLDEIFKFVAIFIVSMLGISLAIMVIRKTLKKEEN